MGGEEEAKQPSAGPEKWDTQTWSPEFTKKVTDLLNLSPLPYLPIFLSLSPSLLLPLPKGIFHPHQRIATHLACEAESGVVDDDFLAVCHSACVGAVQLRGGKGGIAGDKGSRVRDQGGKDVEHRFGLSGASARPRGHGDSRSLLLVHLCSHLRPSGGHTSAGRPRKGTLTISVNCLLAGSFLTQSVRHSPKFSHCSSLIG